MVNLEKALVNLLKLFREKSIKVVLVGGLACGVWKHIRATTDIDFLVHEDFCEAIIEAMKFLGYLNCIEYDELGIIKFDEVADKGLPEVDFVIANREYLKEIFKTAIMADYGEEKLHIANPEQLITLKLKAIKDNPEQDLDWFDIKNLIRLNSESVSLNRMEDLLKQFDLMERLDELRKEFTKTGS